MDDTSSHENLTSLTHSTRGCRAIPGPRRHRFAIVDSASFCRLAAIAVLGIVFAANADAAWEARGIGGGGALFVPRISPHDPNVVYMATDMTTVFRTVDFGDTWDFMPFSQIQGGLDTPVQFTADPNILYGSRNADVLWGYLTPIKSTNGGATWTPLPGDPTDHEAWAVFADPDSTTRVIVANYSDIYFSSDGGDNFALAYATPGTQSDARIAGVVWDGSTIIIGTSYGLVVSSDGGATFSFMSVPGLPADWGLLDLCGAREGATLRLFATGRHRADLYPGLNPVEWWSDSQVFMMDWGAGAWTQLPHPGGGLFPYFVECARDDIQTVYVAGGSQTTFVPSIYKSTNAGAAWSLVFETSGNANIATGWCGDGGDLEWWWAESPLGFGVCPTNPNRVVVTDWGFVHVSNDGGQSWRAAYVQPGDRNPSGQSTPNGKAYTTSGVENTSVWWLHWNDPNTLFAAFTDVNGLRSTDGGHTWVAGRALGLPENNTYCVAEDPTTGTMYAATASVHDLYQSTYLADDEIDGSTGQVIYSSDGGATWDILHDFGHAVIWVLLDPGDPSTLYASVVHRTAGDIYVTHDLDAGAAATWQRLASPPRTEGHPFNIRALDDGTLIATYSGRRDASGFTLSSGVFVSIDGGASWVDRSHPNMMRWTKDIEIDPHDAQQNTWYVAVFSHWGAFPNEVGGVYRTTDRGQNWQRISDLYRVESVRVHPVDPDFAYVTTETSGLWQTTSLRDANPAFTRVDDYPFRQPVRVFFDPLDPDEVWVTSFGGGLRVKNFAGGCDIDGDGVVTSVDVAAMMGCLAGPEQPLDAGCDAADFDGDDDCDLADLAAFQECFAAE